MPMDNFEVQSNPLAGVYGQLINHASLMTANSADILMVASPNQWYFMSFPCDVRMADIKHSAARDFVFRYYDGENRAKNGTGSNWKNVPADSVLHAGQGYIFQTSYAGNIVASVRPEAISQLLSHNDRIMTAKAWDSENAANAGWNYLANPYPSYYDMYASSLTCPITVWDGSKYVAYSLADDNVVLAPMQGFFMQQTELDAEVSYETSGCQFTTEISRPEAPKATDGRAIFNLYLNDVAGNADKTRVVANEAASTEYEPACDAAKFFGEGKISTIYSLGTGRTPMAINERPVAGTAISLGCRFATDGEYTLSLDGAADIILHDALLNSKVTLHSGEAYTFTASEGTDDNRFSFTIDPNFMTGIDDQAISGCSVSVLKGALSITAPTGSKADVYTADGIKAASVILTDGNAVITPGRGVYVVRVANKSFKCVVTE